MNYANAIVSTTAANKENNLQDMRKIVTILSFRLLLCFSYATMLVDVLLVPLFGNSKNSIEVPDSGQFNQRFVFLNQFVRNRV